MPDLIKSLNPNYPYSPIAYHDTWLSVDPIIGCSRDCQYCYMQVTQWTAVAPELICSISEVVDRLLSHKYFAPHSTLLCFGNQTDCFLPENIAHTRHFFGSLEQKQLRNPVAVVTKMRVPESFAEYAAGLQYVRPVFLISYSGLPASVEKGINPEDALYSMQCLFEHGLRVIHFFRPLVQMNGTSDALRTILSSIARCAIASVYFGLSLSPSLNRVYAATPALQIPPHLRSQYGEYIPEGVKAKLRTLVRREFPQHPLYKHTSCAVSLALNIPDYTATVYDSPVCGPSQCPNWKRRICEQARSIPTPRRVRRLLASIGRDCQFEITERAVEISGTINQEDYSFLLHQLNFPLVARDIVYNRLLRGSIFRKASGS